MFMLMYTPMPFPVQVVSRSAFGIEGDYDLCERYYLSCLIKKRGYQCKTQTNKQTNKLPLPSNSAEKLPHL